MRKRIPICVTLVFLLMLLVGNLAENSDGSAYIGTGMIEISTSNTWYIRWRTMNGQMTETLSFDGEAKLEYDIKVNADEVEVMVEQGNVSKKLDLTDTELSLEEFKNGKIKIILNVKNGKSSYLQFELK